LTVGDTQWPRYYVFEQPEENAAFILAGSVHAPDGEMALLIARDTFARRPQRTAMWVARDLRITSRTREQLTTTGDPAGEPAEGELRFQVFAKRSHRGVHTHVGEVTAADPEAAIQTAVRRFGEEKALAWLVVADADLRRSEAADREVLYDSSPGKSFRHENEYPVRTMILDLKRKTAK
jgi:ring-1,2-phenylacetyl-CoA epoxidase subunit PaaB